MEKESAVKINFSFFRVLAYSYLSSFIFFYVELIVMHGFEFYNKWLFPLLNTAWFGTICLFVLFWSITVFRSFVLLFILSFVAFGLNIWNAVHQAKLAQLTSKSFGLYFYQNGEVTIYGFISESMNPLLLIILISILCMVKYGNGRQYFEQMDTVENVPNSEDVKE